jgi:hypothetical protein
MNELAMNLATGRVDYGYLEVLIVAKAFIEKTPGYGAAMGDRFGIRVEFDSGSVSERNTVYHIEEKFLHRSQPCLVLVASQFLFLNSMRSAPATCRCRLRSGPGGKVRA